MFGVSFSEFNKAWVPKEKKKTLPIIIDESDPFDTCRAAYYGDGSDEFPISDEKEKKNKKRSLDPEDEEALKGCKQVLNSIKKQFVNKPFLAAVSVTEYPTYASVIAAPMDLGLVMKKLESGEYDCKDDFVMDVQMVYSNAKLFSPDPKHPIHRLAVEASSQFELLMSRLGSSLPKKPQKPKNPRKKMKKEEKEVVMKEAEDNQVAERLSLMAKELDRLKKEVSLQEKDEFENRPLSKFDIEWIKRKLQFLMDKQWLDKQTVDFIVSLGDLKPDSNGEFELRVDLLKPKSQRLLYHKLVSVNREMELHDSRSNNADLGSENDEDDE